MNSEPAILYVEDDPNSRTVMEHYLRFRMKLPHITILEDSNNFQEKLRTLNPPPDVIFLDIHMEPHTGFEVLKALREYDQFKDIPVVALTASVMREEVEMMQAAGFDGCIAKPVDVDTFENNLMGILSGVPVWQIT